MAHITDERLKEMEEEMNRFEHEIGVPGNDPHIMISMQMMGKGTGMSPGSELQQMHNQVHFVPHQLQRGPMSQNEQNMEQQMHHFSSVNMTPVGSHPSMNQDPTAASPAVYMARPVKTVTVQAPILPTPQLQNYVNVSAAPPLAPPPPPPAAMNFIPAQSVLYPRNTETNNSTQKDRPRVMPSSNATRDNDSPSMSHSNPHSIMGNTNLTKKTSKKKKIVRVAGNQVWEDNSLLEWDPDDFRIFCGDLGNDVTDEVLMRTFGRYPSFVKAKVVRDKRTNKTKGFGFVSFKDPQDFIKAMREMNGKYVGSRPIKLRKSTWKDRNIEIVKKKQKEKERLGL